MGSERFIRSTAQAPVSNREHASSDTRLPGVAAGQGRRAQQQRRQGLQDFLQQQDAADLAQRLWAWAQSDSELMADLTAWAARSRSHGDPQTMKKVVADLLANREPLDWRESAAYASRAEKALPLIESVLAHDPEQARALCEHALRRIYLVCDEADDSGGEISEVMDQLMELLLRCLRAAPPAANWLDDWFNLMQADPWGLWNEPAVLAAAGGAVQQAYQSKAAEEWQDWVARHPPAVTTTADGGKGRRGASQRQSAVSAVAGQGGRFDYQREQLRRRYLDVLKSQGDKQAVIDLMRSSLTDAAEHSELVAYYESLGKKDEALAQARAATRLYPNDWRCEQDLLRRCERGGWHEEALVIRRRQVEHMPDVEHYQAALLAAGKAGRDLAIYRDELFTWAADREIAPPFGGRSMASPATAQGRHVDTRVSWLLAEAKLDDALALVQPPHVCRPALLRTIAKALPPSRHAQAVPLLQRVFAAWMTRASTPYMEVLEIVRETLERLPAPERDQWLMLLRAQYKAKRNFIKGLDALPRRG